MKSKTIDNLVICSTLNQITNYLIIKNYKPKRIFNISFNQQAREKMNISIKNEEWDKYLAQAVIEEDKFKNTIELSDTDMYSILDIRDVLETEIVDKVGNQNIYWHITGGQRTIALAINELVKERTKDRVMYIEGNTERLIINDYKGELLTSDENYEYKDLTLKEALSLTGFNTKNLKSTNILKAKAENKIEDTNKGYRFYSLLHKIIIDERAKSLSIFYNSKEFNDSVRNLILKSNTISKVQKEREKFIKLVFEKLLSEYKSLEEIGYYQMKENSKEDNEFNKSYPAGYIFEKITAYKIYGLIKNNPKIICMETSLKTYFIDKRKPDHIIDELDIVLLTSTGKIVNFECKSGGMKGDNAKSTNYTTYRLSGVFGMPILLSPLYKDEVKDHFNKDNEFKHQMQALSAAKAAELEVFTIDKIKEGLKKLGITNN